MAKVNNFCTQQTIYQLAVHRISVNIGGHFVHARTHAVCAMSSVLLGKEIATKVIALMMN